MTRKPRPIPIATPGSRATGLGDIARFLASSVAAGVSRSRDPEVMGASMAGSNRVYQRYVSRAPNAAVAAGDAEPRISRRFSNNRRVDVRINGMNPAPQGR